MKTDLNRFNTKFHAVFLATVVILSILNLETLSSLPKHWDQGRDGELQGVALTRL